MLQTLRVKNLALVENVSIEFQSGLNVITGETGAGKSILIGALALLLGERADKAMIRSGEEQCGAEAVFQLSNPSDVDAILSEFALPGCDGGQLVIRRIISTAGASRNFVNDSSTTLQVLKRIGETLIDMHGPHDHQSLLSPEFQLRVLDAFGQLESPRAEYEAAYREWIELDRKRKALEGNDQDVVQLIDMLSFQVKEIEGAALVEGEDEQLAREQTVVANAQRVLELGDGIRNDLTEQETSAFNSLAQVQTALGDLNRLVGDPAVPWQAEARSMAVRIQELSNEVSSYVQGIEADPQRLQWLEDRMALYHRLKRKYGGSVSDVLALLERNKERLHDLETRGQQIAEIEAARAQKRQEMTDTGRKLGKKRRSAAGKLAEAATRELRALGFEHGSFDVALREAEPRASGMDEAEFGFAPNAGEPMRPLRAIASSGEISRVMLALKTVLAAHDRIPVLVFDEIDVNIGGKTGTAVGLKLADVARRHQVLCITHLPQVAVYGQAHYAVTKETAAGRTLTRISSLDTSARIEEIARMLGGKDMTSVTVRHAREMLQKAKE